MASTNLPRRDFLRTLAAAGAGAGAATSLPGAIARALAIPAHRSTRSLRDVEHVVILTQENRSFDHYFGTLRGVRGFGDRFPIPAPDRPGLVGRTVWLQPGVNAPVVAPFRLDTELAFGTMRVTGTPHTWPDAQLAWNHGMLDAWPASKEDHSLGYFTEADVPFQYALANAFTICDAYHCSFQGGTNPNRVYLWSGANDASGRHRGPVTTNAYDNLEFDPGGGYLWTTYAERLERAGVRWQVYQNMADNFTDNPLAGFRTFRASIAGEPGSLPALAAKGLRTRDLDLLREDVLSGNLPQVSWIVGTAEGSEHPGPSSPAQGAEYTARVLDALTVDPEVWSKTVLILNFDENDGFFDHVPPPAVPSREPSGEIAGDSTVSTEGEYHERVESNADELLQSLRGRPYGLGPRVPLYVVSPWSKGGWVSSQVFDHTSVIRFLERRFGVYEPNITPWRRAVCGDLTSAFDFGSADDSEFLADLPDPTELAARARELAETTTPATPRHVALPEQDYGVRPSRALPYALHVHAAVSDDEAKLSFENEGRAGAVFHVYDRLHLERVPRRYTVEAQKRLRGSYALSADGGEYDLWVLGPNGFHRRIAGSSVAGEPQPSVYAAYEPLAGNLVLWLHNPSGTSLTFVIEHEAYFRGREHELELPARARSLRAFALGESAHWYDLSVRVRQLPTYLRRFAGRVETGRHGLSDPALGGVARVSG